MVSISIPWTRIASVALRPLLFSGQQEGSLGGATLHIARLGDRFAADVQTTKFQQDDVSRQFIAAMFQATTLDAKIALYQPALHGARTWSVPLVDGAGQSGSTLAIRALYPGQAIRNGQLFNVIHAGVAFIYMATANLLADAAGKAAVPIWPMLRFLTVDGEPCNFVDPVIEGQLVGFDKGATFVKASVNPLSFSILERK